MHQQGLSSGTACAALAVVVLLAPWAPFILLSGRNAAATVMPSVWSAPRALRPGGGGGGSSSTGPSSAGDIESCTLASTTYTPSALERAWLDNVKSWTGSRAAFCKAAAGFDQQVTAWLGTIAANANGTSMASPPSDTAVFSKFERVVTCGSATKQATTWIEPLSHGLRDPRCFCPDASADTKYLDSKDYLLTSFGDDHSRENIGCKGRTCQTLLLDMGATFWPSQVSLSASSPCS
jgi:hypothetical protein